MVLTILFLVLLILGIALFLLFIFMLFLPSLGAQKMKAADFMFSREEVNAVLGLDDFKWSDKRIDYEKDAEGNLFFSIYNRDDNTRNNKSENKKRLSVIDKFLYKLYSKNL